MTGEKSIHGSIITVLCWIRVNVFNMEHLLLNLGSDPAKVTYSSVIPLKNLLNYIIDQGFVEYLKQTLPKSLSTCVRFDPRFAQKAVVCCCKELLVNAERFYLQYGSPEDGTLSKMNSGAAAAAVEWIGNHTGGMTERILVQ